MAKCPQCNHLMLWGDAFKYSFSAGIKCKSCSTRLFLKKNDELLFLSIQLFLAIPVFILPHTFLYTMLLLIYGIIGYIVEYPFIWSKLTLEARDRSLLFSRPKDKEAV